VSRRRLPSAEELRLWRAAMHDADPLPGRRHAPEPPAPEPPPGPGPLPAPPSLLSISPAPPTGRDRHLPRLDLTSSPGVDRRTEERLRRGRFAIEGRIDLHGMTQAEAHSALVGFVLRSWHERRRHVLVITGKGARGGGVLRAAVPRWLDEPPLRPLVLALRHAQPQHGGEGALYVLLKRHRDEG
jgi:DNA-nicking Smr family endonuclease